MANPNRDEFSIVGQTGRGGRHAVTHKSAFVGYTIGGDRRFIVGTRPEVEGLLDLMLEYADFRDDVSHACVFIPRL